MVLIKLLLHVLVIVCISAIPPAAIRWSSVLRGQQASFVSHVFTVMALPNYPRNTLRCDPAHVCLR